MAESDRERDRDALLLRATVLAAGQKMRAATELLGSNGALPSEEQLADAGMLCADAGRLLESAYHDLVAVRVAARFEKRRSWRGGLDR